jgi:hypothetical protein
VTKQVEYVRKRGVLGKVCKGIFLVFNGLMFWWLADALTRVAWQDRRFLHSRGSLADRSCHQCEGKNCGNGRVILRSLFLSPIWRPNSLWSPQAKRRNRHPPFCVGGARRSSLLSPQLFPQFSAGAVFWQSCSL